MGENRDVVKLVVSEYKVATPQLSVPSDAPNWVQHVFPTLMQSIYNGFNSVIEKMVCGFNDSFDFMQHQIDSLSKSLKEHSSQIESLKLAMQQKQYDAEEQEVTISKLKDSIDANESYSRGIIWSLADSS